MASPHPSRTWTLLLPPMLAVAWSGFSAPLPGAPAAQHPKVHRGPEAPADARAAGRSRKGKKGKEVIKTLVNGGPRKKSVDVLFVGDGYTKTQAAEFWKDVDRYHTRFLKEPPFSWYRKRFNIHGLFLPSRDEGCDKSMAQNRKRTILECYFDSPKGRLLQFRDKKELARQVKLVEDVDIVFVMVNIDKYGGSGSVLRRIHKRGRPLPAPTFAAQNNRSFRIAIHELGHSFARLADEYVDPVAARRYRMPRGDRDLLHSNVTLPGHFDNSSFETLKKTVKWRHLMELPGAEKHRWIYEGGYYRRQKVFRPWPTCMMRNQRSKFCPVCMEEMAEAIMKACGEAWDAKAYYKAHPLSFWK